VVEWLRRSRHLGPGSAVSAEVRDDALVVLPTYNEAENLESIARAILAQGPRLLIVDDGSPDGTGRIADRLAADDRIDVLHRSEKAGLGPAYAAGFAAGLEGGAGILCEMDADFSHDPRDLPRLLAAVDAGADVAIGSRYVSGGGVDDWPWHRRALSRGGNLYANVMLGTRIGDMTSGFRAFRADALRRLHPDDCRASGYAFQIEMAWRAARLGLRIEEVPIVFRDREAGDSKMNSVIALEAIKLVTTWGLGRLVGRLPWPAGEGR
jgi:dolichol-phosphate mannosyltransferase